MLTSPTPLCRPRQVPERRGGVVPGEPKNAGAWSYVRPRIETASRDVRKLVPSYAGRKPIASTATGYGVAHQGGETFLAAALD